MIIVSIISSIVMLHLIHVVRSGDSWLRPGHIPLSEGWNSPGPEREALKFLDLGILMAT